MPDVFRASGGVMILCRLALQDDGRAALTEATQAISALYPATCDAIVLTDAQGAIVEANEGFLVLSDAAQLRDVQARSVADFLSLGSVDLNLIPEITRKAFTPNCANTTC